MNQLIFIYLYYWWFSCIILYKVSWIIEALWLVKRSPFHGDSFSFFPGRRLHSLERQPLFTAILDFLYPGKRPWRLTQPTHVVYLRKAIFRSLLSRKATPVIHYKWPRHAYTQTACVSVGVPMAARYWHRARGSSRDIMCNTREVFNKTFYLSLHRWGILGNDIFLK